MVVHIVNGSSYCIALNFTSDTNLVTNFIVDPTLYKICHHNYISGKIDFNIPLLPPPSSPSPPHTHPPPIQMVQKALTNFT